jgi:hypothetical protein
MLVETYTGSYTDVGSMYVVPSGDVYLSGPGAATWTSLAGITFPAPSASLTVTSPPLQNGWKNEPTAGTGSVGFARSSDGIIYLRGSVEAGTTDTIVFRLPPADQPLHALYLPMWTLNGEPGVLTINTEGAGAAIVYNGDSTAQSSFSGISFPVNS